jgi:hypothetical protein
MATVPYNPVPSVAPGGTPQSRFHADVSADTFGGNVGAALGALGGQLQKSGNELFERGVAMQTLYNQSEAQDADARYTEEAGKLHADYNSLQGKAAVEAYPGYIDSLKKTRQSIRDGLSNQTSQKLFESASNGTMGRSIFNGAGHAAGENKKYAMGAATARISANGNAALSFPEDDRSFKASLERTENDVRGMGNLTGMAPEAIDEAVSLQKSKLWGERVKGLAKQDPLVAGRMLEDGIKRGDIRGEDIGKLTNLVDQQRRTVGARMISKQVSTGEGLSYGTGVVDIKQAAEAIGTFESGGRYDLQGVQTKHGRALGKYQVMENFLPEFLRDAGMPAMTKEEFLKSPSAQDQLFNSRFGSYMKETGSFNDAASKWFSGKTMAEAGSRKDALGTTVPAYVANVNAILAKNAPLAQKMAKGTELAAAAAPGDPLFPEYVEQRIKTDNDRAIAVRRDTEFQNRQTIEEGLMGGSSGRLPTTVEELTSDPKSAQAWEDLLPSTQRRYMSVLARNAKGDTNWTDTSLRVYQNLKGQAAANPAEFLDMDVVSMELPNSAKRELINLQGRLKGKAEADPRVTRALGILAPDLAAAGIEKKDKEEFYQFTGALADQLQDLAEKEKRPPKYEEIKTLGMRLLQQQTVPGYLWNSKSPTFSVPVPSDEAEKIKQSGEWSKMSITPTPEMIQRIYTRGLYQKLYGGSVKSDPLANAPSAPVSK